MLPHLTLTRVGNAVFFASEDGKPVDEKQTHTEQKDETQADAKEQPAPHPLSLMPIAEGLALAMAVGMACLGIAKITAAAIEAAARQPEAAGKMQTMMILGIAFMEALVLLTIIFAGLPLIMGR